MNYSCMNVFISIGGFVHFIYSLDGVDSSWYPLLEQNQVRAPFNERCCGSSSRRLVLRHLSAVYLNAVKDVSLRRREEN